MSDDAPLADSQPGETVTMSGESEVYLYDVNRDWIGEDKRIDEYRVADAEIDGHNLRLSVEADVTKVDPHTKPGFQTSEQYDKWQARQSEIETVGNETDGSVAFKTPKTLTSAMAGAIASLVGFFVIRDVTLSIQGQPIEPPTFVEFVPVLLIMVALISVVDYYLRRKLGGAGV